MRSPKIGVAIPTRNAARYVERCLTTIAAQTYPCRAYVQDDASTDATYEFLEARPSWYDGLARNDRRRGWPTTLNRAARQAIDDDCDAVFLMNADDFLRLDAIERLAAKLPGNDFVLVTGQQVGGDDVVQICKPNATWEDFLDHPPFMQEALVTAEAWRAVGGYSLDVTLEASWGFKEDWDFWLKMHHAGRWRYAVVEEPVYYYVMHEHQLHLADAGRYEEARRKILRKHHLPLGRGRRPAKDWRERT